MKKETLAIGTKGYILYSPFSKSYFFRIYKENGEFIDYDIHCEELEVEITSSWVSFYENENGDKILDWSSKALGKN